MKRKFDKTCLNPSCVGSGCEDIASATDREVTFFSLSNDHTRRRKICPKCRDTVKEKV